MVIHIVSKGYGCVAVLKLPSFAADGHRELVKFWKLIQTELRKILGIQLPWNPKLYFIPF